MAWHVDIVQNEWTAGRQLVVGRFSPDGHGHLSFHGEAAREARLRELLQVPADLVVPASFEEAQESLAPVIARLQGSFSFASGPHDDAACPFESGGALKAVPIPQQAKDPSVTAEPA